MSNLTLNKAATMTSDGLERTPIFAGFTASERQQLADIAHPLEFSPGEIVLDEGGTSQALWVLLEGRCEVFKAGENGYGPVKLATLEPHSNFGEMSFFQAAPHSASVRAVSHVRLLRIDRDRFDALTERSPAVACKLAMNAVGCLSDRMRHMGDWVSELMSEKAQKAKSAPVSELSRLREKLFNGWNL